MGANMACETGHLGVIFLSIVALRGLKKCGQRRLGVDMDTPSTWELHRHIGALRGALGCGRLLGLEVTVFEHSGDLCSALQLHLAPRSPDLRFA